jgi:hypothetical protein
VEILLDIFAKESSGQQDPREFFPLSDDSGKIHLRFNKTCIVDYLFTLGRG